MADGALRPEIERTGPVLYARLFGTFGLQGSGGGEIARFRSRKTLAILACLLTAGGHPIGRDRLIGLLWSTRGEEQARASLRQALAELRSSDAAGALLIDRTSLSLRPGTIVTELDLLAGGTDLATVAEQLDNLSGDVLAGLDGVDPELDGWLATERRRLVERAVGVAIRRCGEQSDAGSLAARRRVVAAIQQLDPVDERLVRLGLRLDAEAGDHGALHRRFRGLESLLREQFHSTPSPRTRELLRELTAKPDTPPAAASPPARTPSPRARPARPREPPVVIIQPIQALDPAHALVADFCRAEIEAAFGGIAELRLVTLDTSDPAALERAAGDAVVSYALRGWLSGVGTDVRLKWLLVRVCDGLIVWSRVFDVARAALGMEIAGVVARVAGAVLPAVERDLEAALAANVAGDDLSAYELYFRGRMLMLGPGGLAERRQAAELFEQAIARSPRLLNAHLDLARLYNTDFEQCLAGHDIAPFRARAFELCAHAVSLEPGSARVGARMGWCYLRRGDAANTCSWFEHAMARSPNHAECLSEVGFGYLMLGDLERAAALLTRAAELNPVPRPVNYADLGTLFLLSGEHERAEAHFEIAQRRTFHYRALRVANRALMDGTGADQANALQRDLRQIHISDDLSSEDALFRTVLSYLPFFRAQDRAVLVEGLRRAGWRLTVEPVLVLDPA